MYSSTGRKSLYVRPPAPPVPQAAWWSSDFVRPAIPLVAGGLAVMALVASLKSPAPAAPNPVVLEPPPQALHVAPQTVNVALKGSRLETAAPVVAASEAEPKRVRVASIAPGMPIGKESEPESPAVSGKAIYGLASYYSQGRKTASGERFNAHELTAAHRTLPFGTRVRVTSLETGRSVTVRINDRGPFVRGRTVDVSRAAAQSHAIMDRGVTKVKLDVLQ